MKPETEALVCFEITQELTAMELNYVIETSFIGSIGHDKTITGSAKVLHEVTVWGPSCRERTSQNVWEIRETGKSLAGTLMRVMERVKTRLAYGTVHQSH